MSKSYKVHIDEIYKAVPVQGRCHDWDVHLNNYSDDSDQYEEDDNRENIDNNIDMEVDHTVLHESDYDIAVEIGREGDTPDPTPLQRNLLQERREPSRYAGGEWDRS